MAIECTNYQDQGLEVSFFLEDTSGLGQPVSSLDVSSDPDVAIGQMFEFIDENCSGDHGLRLHSDSIEMMCEDGSKEFFFSDLSDECHSEVFIETLYRFLIEGGL